VCVCVCVCGYVYCIKITYGFFVVILGFRSDSVDFLDAVLYSILYEARVEKLHSLCGSITRTVVSATAVLGRCGRGFDGGGGDT
jgi:hypothetical protein